MKRIFALILALTMLLTLGACKKKDSTDVPDIGGKGEGRPTDTQTAEDDGQAIGVANPYEEINAEKAQELTGIALSVPADTKNLHWFDIDTGAGTRMLQLQFVKDGVQYVLRGKSAGRLSNIAAVWSSWDSETETSVNGHDAKLCLSNSGAGAILWFDSQRSMTYALSTSSGAQADPLTELAEALYAEGGKQDVQPQTQDTTVNVYHPAENAVSFIATAYDTKELTGAFLVEKLVELGVLDKGVELVSMDGMSIDESGGMELCLDFNSALDVQLKRCNAHWEHMYVGSIVNTFIKAFGAKRVWLQVDGAPAVGSDGAYDYALSYYSEYIEPDKEDKPTEDKPEDKPKEDEPKEEPKAPDPNLSTAENVCELAKSKIGAEYEYAATGPDTFDNSGFVYYCFKENGVTIPRRTTEMYSKGSAVSKNDLQPGDVVFFTYEDDGSPSYVGIYLGEGKFIAENKEGNPVKIMDMTTSYFQEIYVGARRYA